MGNNNIINILFYELWFNKAHSQQVSQRSHRANYVYHFLMTENYSLSPLDWKVLQSVQLSALYGTYRRV